MPADTAAARRPALVLAPGAFRLLLAGAVVFSHVTRFDVGRIAVLAFFYLSGYWTSRIWTETAGGGVTRFYASRYLRIMPLYLVVLGLAAAALGGALHPENLALLGVATTHRDPLGVAWSLDVELQFYVLAPLLSMLAAGVALPTVLGLSLLAGAAGLWLEEASGAVTAAKYAPLFVLGVLTHARDWRPSARLATLSLAGFAAATAVTTFTPFLQKTTPDPFDRDVYAFVWLLPLLPWIAHALQTRSSRLDRHLGNLSYPLYLVHAPVLALAAQALGDTPAGKLTGLAAAAAVTLALYVAVDRPLDAWRLAVTGRAGRPSRPLVDLFLIRQRMVEAAHHLLGADLPEPRQRRVPVAQQVAGQGRAGLPVMLLDQAAQDTLPVGAGDTAGDHAVGVEPGVEPAVRVVDEGHAAGHAGREVEAHRPEDRDDAAGHVFAAVGPAAFDDRRRPRVADGEALAGKAGGEQPARRRAVEHGVADEGVAVRIGEVRRRFDDDDGPGEPLADVVVGLAGDLEAQPLDREGAEALSGRSAELDREVSRRKPVEPEGPDHV